MKSRSALVLVACLAVLVAALAGGYFLFLSERPTTVQSEIADNSIGSGHEIELEGSVSPAAEGRKIALELRRPDGAWRSVGSTFTDAGGKFAFSEKLAEQGKTALRTVVREDGRYSAVTGDALAVVVLQPTKIAVEVPPLMRTDRAAKVTGTVRPSETRDVVMEASLNEETWSEVARGESDGATGKFALVAKGLVLGDYFVRVRSEETSRTAEGLSDAEGAVVADYVAAGKKYLEIVAPTNAYLDEINGAFDRWQLSELKTKSARNSALLSRAARQFQRYQAWPNAVQKDIEAMARGILLEADYYNGVGMASSLSEADGVEYPESQKGFDNAPVLIRATLGLPKRG